MNGKTCVMPFRPCFADSLTVLIAGLSIGHKGLGRQPGAQESSHIPL